MGLVVSSCVSAPHSDAMRTRIVGALKKTPFMQMMDDKTLDDIAQCFQLVTYPKGAVIKVEPWLFVIIAEGSVNISSVLPTKLKNNAKQDIVELLCQRQVGDYISFAAREHMLARLLEEQLHTPGHSKAGRKNLVAMLELNRCTADPERGCTVLKLHRDRFLKLRSRFEMRKPHGKVTARFSGHSAARNRAASMTGPEKIHLINSIVESEVVNYLFEIPFLEGVDDSRLVTLSNLCSYMFIRRDEVLCKEGEIGDRFFICIRGSLQASVLVTQQRRHNQHIATTDEPKLQAVKRLGSGSYFGEISLLFKIPRICSITALEDSLLVYIDRVAFCNFLKIVPESSLVLLEHVRLHFLDTLIKQGCRFLNAFPHLKLQELSFISELVERQEGETILRRGEKSPGFYILLRGQVQLEYFAITKSKRDNEQSDAPQTENASSAGTKATTAVPPKEIVTVGPGGYFGQEAIILGISSPIRVKCLDHCLLLRLTNEGFAEFFSSLPEVYSEFCIKCLRDRVRPEHVMQHYEAHKLWAADCVTRRRNQEIALFEQIEDFKWEADLAEERIHERALVVYFRFLAQNAPNCVRVSSKNLQQIESELSSHMISRDIFQSVRNEILELMEDEHFQAFRQSSLFQEFLQTLHCPQTIYDGLTTDQLERFDMSWKTKGRGALEVEDFDEDEDEDADEFDFHRRASIYGSTLLPSISVTDVAQSLTGDMSMSRQATMASMALSSGRRAQLGSYRRRKTKTDLTQQQHTVSNAFVF